MLGDDLSDLSDENVIFMRKLELGETHPVGI